MAEPWCRRRNRTFDTDEHSAGNAVGKTRNEEYARAYRGSRKNLAGRIVRAPTSAPALRASGSVGIRYGIFA
jgi:hypothetical protein